MVVDEQKAKRPKLKALNTNKHIKKNSFKLYAFSFTLRICLIH
jgi:hypothetical protein